MNWEQESLLSILPPSICKEVQAYLSQLLEIRIRVDQNVQFILSNQIIAGKNHAKQEDLQFIINKASRYSPWLSVTMSQGYLTAPGGHRIGVCGQASVKDGILSTIRQPMSLCIRIARDYSGIADGIPKSNCNYILLGPPGSGKTTLLRDLIRAFSDQIQGSICVIDEREELFPVCNDRYVFNTGRCTDILSGCPKSQGVLISLRTMGPRYIAVDEITEEKDCVALERAAWCGVGLLATAHASSIVDLYSRPVYRRICEKKLFDYAVVLSMDKSYIVERINQ